MRVLLLICALVCAQAWRVDEARFGKDDSCSHFRFSTAPAGTGAKCDAHIQPDNPRLCFIVPSTTHGVKGISTPETLPLMKNLIPTLPQTFDASENIHLALYLGYDQGDKFYDNQENLDKLKAAINTATSLLGDQKIGKKTYAGVNFVKLPVESKKSLTKMWNHLFNVAFDDKCDYMYQIGDDVKLVTKGWATAFVNKLKSQGNFGLIGPSDNTKGMTALSWAEQAVVPRSHKLIFDRLFDESFPNYSCDLYLSNIYGKDYTTISREFRVYNTVRGGRYQPTSPEHKLVQSAVEKSRHVACDWLRQCQQPNADKICDSILNSPNNSFREIFRKVL